MTEAKEKERLRNLINLLDRIKSCARAGHTNCAFYDSEDLPDDVKELERLGYTIVLPVKKIFIPSGSSYPNQISFQTLQYGTTSTAIHPEYIYEPGSISWAEES